MIIRLMEDHKTHRWMLRMIKISVVMTNPCIELPVCSVAMTVDYNKNR